MSWDFLFYLLLFVIAFLYSSVGHGGASGYLALMAIWGLEVSSMKTSALILNVIVSFIAFSLFSYHKHFRIGLFWPFAISSIPAAFIGASVEIELDIYRKILGICLLLGTFRLIIPRQTVNDFSNVQIPIALLTGALIGFVSGMIGIGGGILLSPLLVLLRWGSMQQIASVSALFIFVNSLSGLLSIYITTSDLPSNEVFYFALVAIPGAILGSLAGSKYLKIKSLYWILSIVLIIAALKLLFS